MRRGEFHFQLTEEGGFKNWEAALMGYYGYQCSPWSMLMLMKWIFGTVLIIQGWVAE